MSSSVRRNLPFYLLVGGALVFLTVPRMAQAGMFLDGAIYASIARNYAAGLGSFWSPYYVQADSFHEQPPLVFALQAIPFAVFGDHLAVERAYSLAAAAITLLLIVSIWRRTFGRSDYDWLPGLFWLLPATVTWSVVNNMLETTQTVFTTAAVLAIVGAVQSRGATRAVLAGLCIGAAVLSKGPAGLFPLAAPAIAFLLFREYRGSSVRTGLLAAATLAAGAGSLAAWPSARESLTAYWNVQVLESLQGARGGGRWQSLARHLGGGIFLRMGGLLLVAAALGSDRGTGVKRGSGPGPPRWTRFFGLLALCASLPLAFSPKISGHYLLPAVPVFALAFAGLALPFVERRLDAWRERPAVSRGIGTVGALLLIAGVAMPLAGHVMEPRDRSWIAEYRALAPALPGGSTLATCEALRNEWGVHAYLQRFFRISLDPGPARPRRHYLRLTDRPCDAPPACSNVVTSTSRFELRECKEGH